MCVNKTKGTLAISCFDLIFISIYFRSFNDDEQGSRAKCQSIVLFLFWEMNRNHLLMSYRNWMEMILCVFQSMRVRAGLLLTFALFFAISALVFHFLAMYVPFNCSCFFLWMNELNRLSKRWIVAIPRHPRGPNDQVHYYSLCIPSAWTSSCDEIDDCWSSSSSLSSTVGFVDWWPSWLYFDVGVRTFTRTFSLELTDFAVADFTFRNDRFPFRLTRGFFNALLTYIGTAGAVGEVRKIVDGDSTFVCLQPIEWSNH